jgi:hypothetical protein
VFEDSLLLAVLRTNIHARGISDISIGQWRNVCYCQLELGVVGRWIKRLPLAIAGTTVPVSGVSVPDNKSRNIPEVVVVRHWAVGVLGIWRGRDSWVKGGANGVSLQAT